jgi:hypothetical protein
MNNVKLKIDLIFSAPESNNSYNLSLIFLKSSCNLPLIFLLLQKFCLKFLSSLVIPKKTMKKFLWDCQNQ